MIHKLEFESAIKIALQTKSIQATTGEELKTYKDMRKTSANDEDAAFGITEDSQGYKIVLDMEGYTVSEPKLQILSDNDLLIEGVSDRKYENGESIYFRRQIVFSSVVNIEAMSAAISSDGVLLIWAPHRVGKVTKASEISQEETVISTEKNIAEFNMIVGKHLDIQKGKSFATDATFQEVKMHYPAALHAAMKRCGGVKEDGETESAAYMRIRKTDPTEENQAIMTLEGYDYYKVIVDMQAYLNCEIKVRLLGFNSFMIECFQEVNGKSKCIWSRHFILQSHINMENIAGMLSDDGLLVLAMPKRVLKHVGSTDVSGTVRGGWVKSFPRQRVVTSESCISGVCSSYKTIPFKGLRNW